METVARRRRDEGRHQDNRTIISDVGSDSRNRLAVANLSLVHHVVRRVGVRGDEYDDAVGAGMLGLLRACADWDPERGASLATYAGLWIRQAVLRHLRDARRSTSCLGVTGAAALDDHRSTDDELVARVVWTQAFRDAVAALDPEVGATMTVFVAHLGDERGAAAAAGDSIGVWRRRCDRAWSMLRHPAGPCLGGGGGGGDDGSYRRWRIPPPTGPFHARGACRGLGVERFFPARGGRTHAAVAVCATCPVRAACAAFATDQTVLCGVWGGTSDLDRRRTRRGVA